MSRVIGAFVLTQLATDCNHLDDYLVLIITARLKWNPRMNDGIDVGLAIFNQCWLFLLQVTLSLLLLLSASEDNSGVSTRLTTIAGPSVG